MNGLVVVLYIAAGAVLATSVLFALWVLLGGLKEES